jgi:predicted short-subunit dehydrogenase-like oxidoreductase (DUF2520 family)
VRLFVLGAGRAGLGVARAVAEAGGTVVGVHGRRPLAAGPPLGAVTAGRIPAALDEATAVLVAVRDHQLDAALDELRARGVPRGAAVLQASGSADPAGFAALRAEGVACGTFHPLVPLARPELAPGLLRGAWVGIDGDAGAQAAASALAAIVGARVLHIPAGEKGRYHAAAVFASNFPTVLAAVAERLLASAGVPAGEAGPAVRHLLSSAAANLAGEDTALALTGPVVRGDVDTVGRHVRALAPTPDVLALYRALALEAVTLARTAGAPEEGLAGVAALLAAPP